MPLLYLRFGRTSGPATEILPARGAPA
jgi:hypothetical protein